MVRELEIVGAGAVGALLHRKAKHAPPPGTPCANCGAELQGAYCHRCGQGADDQHRSIWRLAWEGIEAVTHLDGRTGQTLPALFLNPGRLARDHREGRRARYVPPFRLFLVSLLIFMLVLESLFHSTGGAPAKPVKAAPAASSSHVAATADLDFTTNSTNRAVDRGAAATIDRDHPGRRSAFSLWLTGHLKRAIQNQEYYKLVLFTWAHRLAVLLLPILAVLLAFVYVGARRFYIYDHLIVAMQFLSFVFLVFALAWIMPGPARGGALLVATAWTPINLYMTLRGGYGSGRFAAAFKALFLWFSTLILFSILVVGLLALALAEM